VPTCGDSTHAIILDVAVRRAVIDTNVLVGALLRSQSWNRDVIRACFEDRVKPLIGHTLLLEYEDVLGRKHLFDRCPLNAVERGQFLEAFLSICDWVQVYYIWRPNLRDEGDNHLVELAVAGGASMIVTNNTADFAHPDLLFPGLCALRPRELLQGLV
jgi:putative PIN family toxin of toxin-antitoxin system